MAVFRHMAILKFKPDARDADIAAYFAAFPKLMASIPVIRAWTIGRNEGAGGETHVKKHNFAEPIYAAPGETQVHLRIWTEDAEHAKKTLDEIVKSFEIALADRIFSQDGSPLEEIIAEQLTLHSATISAAVRTGMGSSLARKCHPHPSIP